MNENETIHFLEDLLNAYEDGAYICYDDSMEAMVKYKLVCCLGFFGNDYLRKVDKSKLCVNHKEESNND